jgi:hypothetical protein
MATDVFSDQVGVVALGSVVIVSPPASSPTQSAAVGHETVTTSSATPVDVACHTADAPADGSVAMSLWPA